MTDIYKTAQHVLVWLGQKSSFHPNPSNVPSHPSPNTDIDGEPLLKWISDNAIFARAWFFRLWTFQEVVLAKRIQVLVGVQSQRWDALAERARVLQFELEYSMRMITMN